MEALLFAHPSVAVVGLPGEKWGETMAAFISPAPGESLHKGLLFAYLRERLAPHKTPRQWFEVAEFPMTDSGKIQKFTLRELWAASELTEA
ncbi:MAG: hypothetical protein HOI95_27200 [Chromatiales bacterium]|nr:hypothetical protein [Chromatiales bacterium]